MCTRARRPTASAARTPTQSRVQTLAAAEPSRASRRSSRHPRAPWTRCVPSGHRAFVRAAHNTRSDSLARARRLGAMGRLVGRARDWSRGDVHALDPGIASSPCRSASQSRLRLPLAWQCYLANELHWLGLLKSCPPQSSSAGTARAAVRRAGSEQAGDPASFGLPRASARGFSDR
jgi:hypothetical protein